MKFDEMEYGLLKHRTQLDNDPTPQDTEVRDDLSLMSNVRAKMVLMATTTSKIEFNY
jgi:hypothetical protein